MRFAFVLILFLSLLVWPAASEESKPDELKSKEAELQKVYRELQQSKERLRLTRQKEQNVLGRLVIIGRDLKKTQKELNVAEKKINVNQQQLGALSVSLKVAEQELQDKGGRLGRRIIEIYKTGGINYLELLLSANTLADFINRSYYFEKLVGRDVNLITEVKKRHTEVKTKKIALEGTTEEIRELAKLIERKKRFMESQAEEKKQVYETLKERRKDYERRIAELERASTEIERLIQRLMAERAAKGIAAPRGTGVLAWPLHGRLTSRFGYRRHPWWGGVSRHTGIDIAAPYGEVIRAADSGEVIFTGWWNGYGKSVIIDHGKRVSTVYGHLSRIYVQNGQVVTRGQVIGLVGSTGYSTGPHLHFEVRKNGVPTNPLPLLP